jgi:hypothetical protein
VLPTSTLPPPTPTPVAPTPTLLPTPALVTPTPVYVEAVPAVGNQWIVKQPALVCGNPCTCAPVVRTIASGTAVTVLETMSCRGDTWSKIADGEWLGPRLLEEDGAIVTTTVP